MASGPLDHAEQEHRKSLPRLDMRACLDMIRDSACPPSCRAPHEGGWAKNPIKGSSAQRLPGLLSRLGQIDLFIHDSRHTERNVRFELDRAWAALRLGGALVVDDIDLNWGFRSFTQTFSGHQCLICYAEPLQPDPPRFDGKGLFGIIRKEVAVDDRCPADE